MDSLGRSAGDNAVCCPTGKSVCIRQIGQGIIQIPFGKQSKPDTRIAGRMITNSTVLDIKRLIWLDPQLVTTPQQRVRVGLFRLVRQRTCDHLEILIQAQCVVFIETFAFLSYNIRSQRKTETCSKNQDTWDFGICSTAAACCLRCSTRLGANADGLGFVAQIG